MKIYVEELKLHPKMFEMIRRLLDPTWISPVAKCTLAFELSKKVIFEDNFVLRFVVAAPKKPAGVSCMLLCDFLTSDKTTVLSKAIHFDDFRPNSLICEIENRGTRYQVKLVVDEKENSFQAMLPNIVLDYRLFFDDLEIEYLRPAAAVHLHQAVTENKEIIAVFSNGTDGNGNPGTLPGASTYVGTLAGLQKSKDKPWLAGNASFWERCWVYDPPLWLVNKPDPGPGYRLVGKSPLEMLHPEDEEWLTELKEWNALPEGESMTQNQGIWYRRKTEIKSCKRPFANAKEYDAVRLRSFKAGNAADSTRLRFLKYDDNGIWFLGTQSTIRSLTWEEAANALRFCDGSYFGKETD